MPWCRTRAAAGTGPTTLGLPLLPGMHLRSWPGGKEGGLVPTMEVRLLGPPRVIASGQILPIRRRKALALIAFLASSRTPHTRELLAAMFWPEADRDSAHAQMRNHLWVLRAAGLGPWLSLEGEMVELREGKDLWIDVREHRRLLGLAGLVPGRRGVLSPQAELSLSEAVEISQESFLNGFHLSDSEAFDEWQLREEEDLRTGLRAALDALIRLREERGDLEGAVASACRRMELDPLDEGSLRTLMTLYKRAGRRQDALLWYERTSRLLDRELKLTPSRETTLLRNQILARGPEEVSPPPEPGPPPRIVLPEPPTPLVGREGELREIARYLEEPGLRFLTLTGPGGCGKTRLALEAGRKLSDRFPDGVVFVSLASAEAGYVIPSTLAEIWSLRSGNGDGGPSLQSSGSAGSFEELLGFLREKRMLLILDNLEQLSHDLGSVRELLAGTRRPAFLATSRVRLGVAGGQILEVEGLPWPERKASLEELASYPSVRLFLQAVRRIRSLSRPSPAELQAAGEISRRLRGHPLGIELAASWAHCMDVAEIAEQLATSLDLEAVPRADIAPRHRSLRAVFAQSWALLTSEEKTALRRLSLSPGSFAREAAMEIGRTTPAVLASLVEQSVLRSLRDRRFEIPETVRQFGREKLAAVARDEAATRDRTARHYLGRWIDARTSLEGPGQSKTLRSLICDRHHLRSAWLWAAERGWCTEMLKATRALFVFYYLANRSAEGAETFGLAVRHLTQSLGGPKGGAVGPRERRLIGFARVAQGWFMRFEDPNRCRRLVRQGQRDLADGGTLGERALADALASLTGPASGHDERRLRERAQQCEEAGDLWCAGLCWEILAFHLRTTNPSEGCRVIHRVLALRRRCRDQWSIAAGIYVLGASLEACGLLRGARRRYEESLARRRRLGAQPDGVFFCLEGIARMALRTGALEDARRYGGEALAVAQRTGDLARVGLAQTRLAHAHYLGGAAVDARPLLESALITAEATHRTEWSSHLHALGGLVALEAGEEEEARWSLDRALSAMPPGAPPVAGMSNLDTFLRGWPTSWRDLLEARVALNRGEYSASRRALGRVIESALARHHKPLLSEALAVWAAWCARTGRRFPVDRLALMRLVGSSLPDERRLRLEGFLRDAERDAPDAPAEAQKASPATSWQAPSGESSDAALFALAAEVLKEEGGAGPHSRTPFGEETGGPVTSGQPSSCSRRRRLPAADSSTRPR